MLCLLLSTGALADSVPFDTGVFTGYIEDGEAFIIAVQDDAPVNVTVPDYISGCPVVYVDQSCGVDHKLYATGMRNNSAHAITTIVGS